MLPKFRRKFNTHFLKKKMLCALVSSFRHDLSMHTVKHRYNSWHFLDVFFWWFKPFSFIKMGIQRASSWTLCAAPVHNSLLRPASQSNAFLKPYTHQQVSRQWAKIFFQCINEKRQNQFVYYPMHFAHRTSRLNKWMTSSTRHLSISEEKTRCLWWIVVDLHSSGRLHFYLKR